MYDDASGIQVFVSPRISEGEPGFEDSRSGGVQEYRPSKNSPLWTGDSRERWIEAITSHQFDLYFFLQPEFSFKGQSCVKISCQLDDGPIHKGAILFEKTVTPVDSMPMLYSTTPVWQFGDFSISAGSVTKRCLGHWEASGFAMGEHWPAVDPELSPGEGKIAFQNMGKIKITLQRSNQWTYKLSARALAATDPTEKHSAT